MTITTLSQSLSDSASEVNQAPVAAPAQSAAQPIDSVLAFLQKIDSRLTAIEDGKTAPKTKKGKAVAAKAEKLAPTLPPAPSGCKWVDGIAEKSQKAYRECEVPGSDGWKVRFYLGSMGLCLVRKGSFIYGDGVVAVNHLAQAWPEALAAIVNAAE